MGSYWQVNIYYRHPDGNVQPVRMKSPIQTKRGAEQYEREVRQALANETYGRKEKKPIPTLNEFSEEFINNYAKLYNL